MAQFIQGNQLAPVEQSIGEQQVVRGSGDAAAGLVSNLTNIVGSSVQTYADVYGPDKAQALVEESIETVDSAIAAAEDQAAMPEAFSDFSRPEGINVSEDEWTILSEAVRSGQMTQDRARLIAASRLRTRIAEQPMLANQLRDAASGILGFNIRSEAAQQYFSHFPTRDQLAKQDDNKIRDDFMNRARAYVEAGVATDVEAAYRFLVNEDYANRSKNLASSQFEEGAITAQQFVSKYEQEDSVAAFGNILGEIKSHELEHGAIDSVAYGRIIDERKQSYIADFNVQWQKGGGTLNTPEYNRALTNIENRYNGYKEFADTLGIDAVNELTIERTNQAYQILGNEQLGQFKFIVENFGQQVGSEILKMFTLPPSQRDLLLSRSPQLKQAWDIMGQDPEEFSKALGNAAIKLYSGDRGNLNDADTPYIDATVDIATSTGTPESASGTIRALAEMQLDWKALSAMSHQSPRRFQEDSDNIEYYKQLYSVGIPEKLSELGQVMGTMAPGAFEFVVDDRGNLSVQTIAPEGEAGPLSRRRREQNPTTASAQRILDQINVFADGHRNGWSRIVGEDLDTYKQRIVREAQQQYQTALDDHTNEVQERFLIHIEEGNTRSARRVYERLREVNPTEFSQPFDEFMEEFLNTYGE